MQSESRYREGVYQPTWEPNPLLQTTGVVYTGRSQASYADRRPDGLPGFVFSYCRFCDTNPVVKVSDDRWRD